ncbi:putative deacylase [Pseudomonas sp. TE3786]
MRHLQHDLLAPVPGTARQIHSFHFGPEQSGKKAYIQASLHADELPGMLVAWHLKQRLAELEAAGQLLGEITLVPVANPIGQAQVVMDMPLGRYELETRENFNRAFINVSQQVGDEVAALLNDDAEHNLRLIRASLKQVLNSRTAATQLQSQRLTLQRLACQADVVLDLHCDFEAVAHLYTTPEAWARVEPLSRYIGTDANLLASDSGGQSFDESFSLFWLQLQQRFGQQFPIAQGAIAVTVEHRGVLDVSHEQAAADCQAILNYLSHFGVIAGEPPALPELRQPATPLAGVEPVTTAVGGLLVFSATPGQIMAAGDLIAEVIDPISDSVTPIYCSTAGLLYARSMRRMATAGMAIAHVAGSNAYRSGYLLSP